MARKTAIIYIDCWGVGGGGGIRFDRFSMYNVCVYVQSTGQAGMKINSTKTKTNIARRISKLEYIIIELVKWNRQVERFDNSVHICCEMYSWFGANMHQLANLHLHDVLDARLHPLFRHHTHHARVRITNSCDWRHAHMFRHSVMIMSLYSNVYMYIWHFVAHVTLWCDVFIGTPTLTLNNDFNFAVHIDAPSHRFIPIRTQWCDNIHFHNWSMFPRWLTWYTFHRAQTIHSIPLNIICLIHIHLSDY